MVLDPSLAEHLAHFGIDMLKMQKVSASSSREYQILFPASVALVCLKLSLPSLQVAWISLEEKSTVNWSFREYYQTLVTYGALGE